MGVSPFIMTFKWNPVADGIWEAEFRNVHLSSSRIETSIDTLFYKLNQK
jgi:hypothetical protein